MDAPVIGREFVMAQRCACKAHRKRCARFARSYINDLGKRPAIPCPRFAVRSP